MKAKILVEIEIEIKDKFWQTNSSNSSDRGVQWSENCKIPTQEDIETSLVEQLQSLHLSASADRFFPFIPLNIVLKETIIINPQNFHRQE